MIGLKSTLVCSSALAFALVVACGESDPETTGTGGSTTVATTSASTTTGTGGATTSSSTTTGTGGGPIECDSAYTDIRQGECDLLQQDCEPGSSCRPYQEMVDMWSTHCVVGGGLKGPASPCSSNNECEAGLFCIGPGALAQCIPVCCEGTNEPCQSGKCNLDVSFGDHYVKMCSFAPECELFTMTACENGAECHIQDPGLATCVPPSGQQVDEGGTCNYLNDCKDMQHCDTGNVCRYYCLTTGSNLDPGLGGCPAAQECIPINNFGFPDVGVCRPM